MIGRNSQSSPTPTGREPKPKEMQQMPRDLHKSTLSSSPEFRIQEGDDKNAPRIPPPGNVPSKREGSIGDGMNFEKPAVTFYKVEEDDKGKCNRNDSTIARGLTTSELQVFIDSVPWRRFRCAVTFLFFLLILCIFATSMGLLIADALHQEEKCPAAK